MDEKTACIIGLILACILILIYLLYQVKKNGLRATVVKFIVRAEENFAKGANWDKMDYVIKQVIAILPFPLGFFITTEAVHNFVQSVFDEVKTALDYKGGQ